MADFTFLLNDVRLGRSFQIKPQVKTKRELQRDLVTVTLLMLLRGAEEPEVFVSRSTSRHLNFTTCV